MGLKEFFLPLGRVENESNNSSLLINFNEWHCQLKNNISLYAFLPVLQVLSNMTGTRERLEVTFFSLFFTELENS